MPDRQSPSPRGTGCSCGILYQYRTSPGNLFAGPALVARVPLIPNSRKCPAMATSPQDRFQSPLETRYASAEMSRLWGDQNRYSTWRKLWVILARSQRELGLTISAEQVGELERHTGQIDFAAAAAHERRLRHDVMAHVHAYGDQCPLARPVIHLGATSCYVTDNTDLLLMREGLQLVVDRLVAATRSLGKFAQRHRATACLGLTHLQPAQPVTFGKRACLWIQDLLGDLDTIEFRLSRLKARGTKGTTGTQASFLQLFDGDHARVRQLDQLVSRAMGFDESYPVTGQTYSRRVDAEIVDALAGLAQSSQKLATDIRLLCSRKEIDEPFESEQIGSSAMAYKRNPMRSERICGLARFLISLQSNTAQTAATQWLERTLDDSANRRLVLPQAFLAADAILILLNNVAGGLEVYDQVALANLRAELPFLATESILMAAVQAGGDRQTLHEQIRVHSQAAAAQVKQLGRPNDLLDRLRKDPAFSQVDLDRLTDPAAFVGRAPQQVGEFLAEVVEPRLAGYPVTSISEELRV